MFLKLCDEFLLPWILFQGLNLHKNTANCSLEMSCHLERRGEQSREKQRRREVEGVGGIAFRHSTKLSYLIRKHISQTLNKVLLLSKRLKYWVLMSFHPDLNEGDPVCLLLQSHIWTFPPPLAIFDFCAVTLRKGLHQLLFSEDCSELP